MPYYNNVIVFGATGNVGSAAAIQAHIEGAKVSLAMRNISKPIPSLDELYFEKIQADLTQPETLKRAVHQTGAKAAFIYAVYDIPDHMRAALQSLKDAGTQFVVFLSSFAIASDIRAVPSTDFIAYEHAQVEIALEEVFGGDNYVAVRPGYFASNILHEKQGILQGEVNLPNPDAIFDFISPDDVGRVAGTILVSGQKERIVGLLGPQKMTLKDAVSTVGNVLGKQVRVTKIPRDEAAARMEKSGLPPNLVNSLLHNVMNLSGRYLETSEASIAAENVLKYTHKPPRRFQEWVENNKETFVD